MKKRIAAFCGFAMMCAVELAICQLHGGFSNTHFDDVALIPLIYCLIRTIYVTENKCLPALIFTLGSLNQLALYITNVGLSNIDTQNLTYTVISSKAYIKTVIGYFAGTILIYFSQIIFDIVRGVLNKEYRANEKRALIALAVGMVLVMSAGGYCMWENYSLVTSHYTYTSEEIGDELDGYKIVQISDLHNQAFGEKSSRLLNAISDESPNIIVVTGDIVDSRHTDIATALEFIQGAVEIAPVYYITGNHEYNLPAEAFNVLMQGMTDAGVTILDNKRVKISVGKESFNLIGLSDTNLTDGTLSRISPSSQNRLNILLAHEPQFISNYAAEDADIVLSGHAHGGQIRLPFIGGLYAPGQGLRPEYYEGTYTVDDTTMIVSRGLGNSVFPLRINDRPEIVVLELKKS